MQRFRGREEQGVVEGMGLAGLTQALQVSEGSEASLSRFEPAQPHAP